MKKNSIVLGVFALVTLGSCKNETPQEKAQKESQKALDKAYDANEANQVATKLQ